MKKKLRKRKKKQNEYSERRNSDDCYNLPFDISTRNILLASGGSI